MVYIRTNPKISICSNNCVGWFYFQVFDPSPDLLPALFDPKILEQLSGEGDSKTLLMLLQSRAELIQNSEEILIEEENLVGDEDAPALSERAFDQSLAIQKSKVWD